MAKKKTEQPATKAKTIGIGRQVPPPTVKVLGVEFEQGENLVYGKCRPKRGHAVIYHFFKVDNNNYILWAAVRGDAAYLDYFTARDPNFTQQYEIIDPDTDIPEVDPDA